MSLSNVVQKQLFKFKVLSTLTANRNVGKNVLQAHGSHSNYVGDFTLSGFRNFSITATVQDKIKVDLDSDGIRSIVINRPEAKNALSFEMMDTLGRVLKESNTDKGTKLITITGNGDFFSSGNDLNNWKAGTVEQVQEKTRKYVLKQLMFGFIDCQKPIIAMVNGGAIGAGATLLPFCDLVLASDKAFFHTPFPALFIVPEFCSSYLFPKIMGLQRANNMLLFGHKLSAKEALDCGFVNKVFPIESFKESCDKMVNAYRQLPTEPLIRSKEVIRGPEREMLRHLCTYEMDLVIEAAGSKELQDNLKKFFSRKG